MNWLYGYRLLYHAEDMTGKKLENSDGAADVLAADSAPATLLAILQANGKARPNSVLRLDSVSNSGAGAFASNGGENLQLCRVWFRFEQSTLFPYSGTPAGTGSFQQARIPAAIPGADHGYLDVAAQDTTPATLLALLSSAGLNPPAGAVGGATYIEGISNFRGGVLS